MQYHDFHLPLEVWEASKAQASALESVSFGGAKGILGYSSRSCNEAVREDIGYRVIEIRQN